MPSRCWASLCYPEFEIGNVSASITMNGSHSKESCSLIILADCSFKLVKIANNLVGSCKERGKSMEIRQPISMSLNQIITHALDIVHRKLCTGMRIHHGSHIDVLLFPGLGCFNG